MDQSDVSENARLFGDRLEQLRLQKGMTQKALAQAVGVAGKTIYRYLHGEQLPAGEEMLKLAMVFPDDMKWLLTGSPPTDMERWQALIHAVPPDRRSDLERCARLFATDAVDLIQALAGTSEAFEAFLHGIRPRLIHPPPRGIRE